MDTKDKLIGLAMILAGIAFIVLGSSVLVRNTKNTNIYNEKQNNVYQEQQVQNNVDNEVK